MNISELQAAYDNVADAKNLGAQAKFAREVAACETVECMEFHFLLLQKIVDDRFHQMIRASFQKRGDDGAAFLEEKLGHDYNDQTRADIIQLLGHLRYKSALPHIRLLLASHSEAVRYASIISIGWMGEISDIALLGGQYAVETVPKLRGFICTAFRQLNFHESNVINNAIGVYKNFVLQERDRSVQQLAIVSMQTISKKSFGLTEDINQNKITGNVEDAWFKMSEFIKSY